MDDVRDTTSIVLATPSPSLPPSPSSTPRAKTSGGGTAEWTGNTCQFRLSRSVDKGRKRHDLRDYLDVLKFLTGEETMSTDPDTAEEQGKLVAAELTARHRDRAMRKTVVSKVGRIVDTWFNDWCEDRARRRIEESTIAADRSSYRKWIAPVIGQMLMTEVSPDDIKQVVANLDDAIESDVIHWKTGSNVWTTLSSMFDDAANSKEKRGLVVRSDDPTAGVRPPERGDDRKKTILYPDEYVQLVTSPTLWEGKGRNVLVGRHFRRWARVFTLALYLNLRAGELRVLRWEDIDLKHRVVTVVIAAVPKTAGREEKTTKAADVRTFAIPEQIIPLLEKMRAEAGGERATGRIIKVPPEGDLSSRLRRYMTMAGLTRAALFADTDTQAPFVFHDLRATGISWRVRRGDDPFTVQNAAGHADLRTTQIYIREMGKLPAEFGTPFPPVPAIVLGPGVAKGSTNGYGSGGGAEHPTHAGPIPAQEIAIDAKNTGNGNTSMGPHNSAPRETTRIPQHLGPSGPTNTTECSKLSTADGQETAPADPVVVAIRRALEAAIASGNVEAAGRLAVALAEEMARPSATVIPIRRVV